MLNPAVTQTIELLEKADLSTEDRSALTASLLDKLHALPLRKTITFDEQGTIQVNGKALDPEQSIVFRNSVSGLNESFARKLIKEQLKFLAVELGVHKGLNTDQIMFAKAALWIIQEEEALIEKILD